MLLLLMLLACAASARADDLKSETKDKLDVVLVMDSSGSMLITDPQRLRDEGAKLLFEFLKPGDRLAVVSFSGDAKIVKPLEDFDQSKIDEYRRSVSSIAADGVYTDLLAGVREAKAILDANHREGANQAIVLLSDGKMDPDPAVGSPTLRTSELIDRFAEVVKDAGIKVYTLCFSDQADKTLLARLAAATEGQSWFTPDADKVHESYADLFLAVKKPQMLALSAKGFVIDANISEATFYINREGNEDIKLRTPDGRELSAAAKDPNIRWYHGQKFDVVSLTQPQVGSWQIVGLPKNDGFATVLTNLKLVTDWPSTVTAESPTLLQARLYESDKPISLPEMSGVTRFAVRITPADKVSEPIIKEEMNDEGKDGDRVAGDGIFSYSVKLESAGEYKLKVLARSPTFERSQQISFRAKPPLIALSIAEEEEEESLASAVEHEEDQKKEEGSTVEEAPHAPKSAHFIIELSEDAQQLKKMQLKLEAADEKKVIYRLPLVQSRESTARYQAAISTLPHDGKYQVRATISGEGKNKKDVRFSSQILEYTKTPADGSAAVHVVLEHDEVKKPEKTPNWLYFLLVTVVNALSGGAAFMLLRKTKPAVTEALPPLDPPAAVSKAIAELEKRFALTEIELDDPLLGSLENVAPAPSASLSRGPAPSAAQDLPPSAAVDDGAAAAAPETPASDEEAEAATPPPEENA